MPSLPISSEPETPHQYPTMVSASDVNQLSARLSALESRLPENSWMWGHSFLRRAFAIWGHYFIAQLIISLILGIIFFACFIGLTALGLGLARR
jgi:predicted PurR-regulated permease PerM